MAAEHDAYLEKALDAYRSAVRAWSRDTLLIGVLCLVLGALLVLPFANWSGQAEQLRAEEAQASRQRERIRKVVGALDSLSGEVADGEAGTRAIR